MHKVIGHYPQISYTVSVNFETTDNIRKENYNIVCKPYVVHKVPDVIHKVPI